MKDCIQGLKPSPYQQNLEMIFRSFLNGVTGRFGGLGV